MPVKSVALVELLNKNLKNLSMLKKRLVTAIILLLLLIPLIVSDNSELFQLFSVGFIVAGAWEWGLLSKLSSNKSIFGSIIVLSAIVIIKYTNVSAYWEYAGLFSSVFWSLGVFFVLKLGPDKWKKIPSLFIWALGFLLLTSAWDSFVSAREIGVNYLISILSIVWLSDVAAYFGGKMFGKKKLAPSISPGKSWEGVFSGMAMVIVAAFIWMWFDKTFAIDGLSFYSLVYQSSSFLFIPVLLLLTGIGVAGDLFESLMKRSVGVKDSSQLLPGHGGVLDRIDALVPVITVSMIIYNLFLVK